jgi:hypothetical protein
MSQTRESNNLAMYHMLRAKYAEVTVSPGSSIHVNFKKHAGVRAVVISRDNGIIGRCLYVLYSVRFESYNSLPEGIDKFNNYILFKFCAESGDRFKPLLFSSLAKETINSFVADGQIHLDAVSSKYNKLVDEIYIDLKTTTNNPTSGPKDDTMSDLQRYSATGASQEASQMHSLGVFKGSDSNLKRKAFYDNIRRLIADFEAVLRTENDY